MKVLKIILLLAVILIGAWLVMCAMAPESIKTSRSITINASAESVYPWVADLAAWQDWSPWQRKDATIVTTVSSVSKGEGASMTWTSKAMGSGRMRITAAVPNQKVSTALSFSGYDQESYSDFIFTEINGETTVEWTMDGGEVAYLFRGFFVLMDAVNTINADYDEGLLALKQNVERNPMRWEEIVIDLDPRDLLPDSLRVDSLVVDSLRVDSLPMPTE
jgi:hypothetical protein